MATACRRHDKRPGLSVFKMDKLCLRQNSGERQDAVASQAKRAMVPSGFHPSVTMAGPFCRTRRGVSEPFVLEFCPNSCWGTEHGMESRIKRNLRITAGN